MFQVEQREEGRGEGEGEGRGGCGDETRLQGAGRGHREVIGGAGMDGLVLLARVARWDGGERRGKCAAEG